MNKELMGALDELEREKNISKETLLDAIEQSLTMYMLPLTEKQAISVYMQTAGL